MSFGFSVGDFFAAIQLANKIRKDFTDAPDQFKTVSNELRSLSIILQDADVAFLKQELGKDQKRNLEDIDTGCREVLNELESIVEKYSELKLENGSVGKRSRRVWKRFKWKPEDINKLRTRITTNIGLLNTFNGQLTRNNVLKLVRHQEDRECEAILNWITPFDYDAQHRDFVTRRQEGTGRWLLDSAEFQSWLETDKQTMFCPGIPGAGKTIITSIVVEELTTRFYSDKDVSIAYLYFNFRRQHEQKPEDMIASLLKQLLQKMSFLSENIRTFYRRHHEKRTRPSLDEILNTLDSVISTYMKVFIIVDAIDECQSSDGCRSKFLSSIFSLQAKTTVKLFATSRPNLDIEQAFKGCLSRDIRAHDEDIWRYLNGRMSQLPSCVLKKQSLQEEIKTEIVKAVDGMFLLAQLYLQSLEDKTTARAVKNALQGFQKQTRSLKEDQKFDILTAAYTEAMDRINSQQTGFRLLANKVLLWITCAERPLTAQELQIAIAVEEGDLELDEDGLPEIEDMISVCAGLVTLDVESNVIRLVHYTTQEYFNQAQERLFIDAEAYITSICVTYLSFDVSKSGACKTDKEFRKRLQLYPFFSYASKNWGHHARRALNWNQTTVKLLINNLFCPNRVNSWSQGLFAFWGIIEYSPHSDDVLEIPNVVTGLHLVAHFGITKILPFLFEKGAELEPKDSSCDQTPLFWAASSGHTAMVKLLLDKGAEIESRDKHRASPLLSAVKARQEAVAKLLLENGAEIEARDEFGYNSLLQAAIGSQEAMVRLLLEQGARIESKDENGCTPLITATRYGNETVVKLLLEKDAKLESKDKWGRTPLFIAARYGDEAVVKILLEKGAEVDSKNNYGQTGLICAIIYQHEAIIKLLLEKGANPELKDSIGRTPFWWAARHGSMAVELLISTGRVDVNTEDYYHSTALSVAARMGHSSVVAFLLTQTCSLFVKDSCNRSPLWWARRTEHLDIAAMLLEKYIENGITLEEDDLLPTKSPLFDLPHSAYCDVCMFSILSEKSNYRCNVCNNGDFAICKDCFAMKAHCLDSSHVLVRI